MNLTFGTNSLYHGSVTVDAANAERLSLSRSLERLRSTASELDQYLLGQNRFAGSNDLENVCRLLDEVGLASPALSMYFFPILQDQCLEQKHCFKALLGLSSPQLRSTGFRREYWGH